MTVGRRNHGRKLLVWDDFRHNFPKNTDVIQIQGTRGFSVERWWMKKAVGCFSSPNQLWDVAWGGRGKSLEAGSSQRRWDGAAWLGNAGAADRDGQGSLWPVCREGARHGRL